MPSIKMYSFPGCPPCRSVQMTAQYIGVEINKINVNLFAQEHLKPEYLRVNPQHCVPTIDDDGFILWESRAIMAYLVNKYAPGNPIYPEDPQARALVDRMLYFDIGTLFKALYQFQRPQMIEREPADPEKEEVLKNALTLLEGFLSKTPYVAGNNITIADLAIISSLTFAEVIDYDYKPYPKIYAWMQKMRTEIPKYEDINDKQLSQFKENLKARK